MGTIKPAGFCISAQGAVVNQRHFILLKLISDELIPSCEIARVFGQNAPCLISYRTNDPATALLPKLPYVYCLSLGNFINKQQLRPSMTVCLRIIDIQNGNDNASEYSRFVSNWAPVTNSAGLLANARQKIKSPDPNAVSSQTAQQQSQ